MLVVLCAPTRSHMLSHSLWLPPPHAPPSIPSGSTSVGGIHPSPHARMHARTGVQQPLHPFRGLCLHLYLHHGIRKVDGI
jgi:hypothetical protein